MFKKEKRRIFREFVAPLCWGTYSVACLEAKVDAADKLPTTQKVLVDKHLLPHGRNHKVVDRLVRKHQEGVAAKNTGGTHVEKNSVSVG
jgi:hypothetical protein